MPQIDREQMEALAELVALKVMKTVHVASTLPRWLTMEEAVVYAKTSKRKLRTWVDEGYIYGFKRTGKYVIDRESIDNWYNSERISIGRF
ncbi:helix-turn-helix domain-containing protein [Desulfoluna spongiiphila]|uniref:Helix-turn-helix domain-containing protein n=1 Tax=Desulfoluna spongiiphila TaxID=419481 RepID=A0A1G5J824_9BACT|nr:helix-turn-helix domain-containing protein [Desulfoluna spongiiphila]SCY84462.1 Helix-turn-helix domain-containing protein [Desulfoluna spongiiphila]